MACIHNIHESSFLINLLRNNKRKLILLIHQKKPAIKPRCTIPSPNGHYLDLQFLPFAKNKKKFLVGLGIGHFDSQQIIFIFFWVPFFAFFARCINFSHYYFPSTFLRKRKNNNLFITFLSNNPKNNDNREARYPNGHYSN